jgi:hypothetical protein
MQFSRDVLLRHAQRRVDQEVDRRQGIIAAYLRGSLLFGSPLLGGAGDIDLVFIHSEEPNPGRTLDPLTPEIHFDIEHHAEKRYRAPQALRTHPWLGPALQEAKPLYDPRHFIDYTQSGVRSNFFSPENTLRRAQQPLENARAFWLEQQLNPPSASAPEILAFLHAAQGAVNALALLNGPPLPTRRLGFEFLPRTEELQAPSAFGSFIRLLGGETLEPSLLQSWLSPWEKTLTRLAPPPPAAGILAGKQTYYQKAIQAFLDSERPHSALWPLLYTWTKSVVMSPAGHKENPAWKEACQELGLWGDAFANRLADLDEFLDQIRHGVDSWAHSHGAALP